MKTATIAVDIFVKPDITASATPLIQSHAIQAAVKSTSCNRGEFILPR